MQQQEILSLLQQNNKQKSSKKMYPRYDYRVDNKLMDYWKWVESRKRNANRLYQVQKKGARVNIQYASDIDKNISSNERIDKCLFNDSKTKQSKQPIHNSQIKSHFSTNIQNKMTSQIHTKNNYNFTANSMANKQVMKSQNKPIKSSRNYSQQINQKYDNGQKYFSQRKKKYDYGVRDEQEKYQLVTKSTKSARKQVEQGRYGNRANFENSKRSLMNENRNRKQQRALINSNFSIRNKQYKFSKPQESNQIFEHKQKINQPHQFSSPIKQSSYSTISNFQVQSDSHKKVSQKNLKSPSCQKNNDNFHASKPLSPQVQNQLQQLKQTQSLLIDKIKQRDQIIQKLQFFIRENIFHNSQNLKKQQKIKQQQQNDKQTNYSQYMSTEKVNLTNFQQTTQQ